MTARGGRAVAPTARESTRGGATASRDIRAFFSRHTPPSGPNLNPLTHPQETPLRYPSPPPGHTLGPAPNLMQDPTTNLIPGPDLVGGPSPSPNPTPTHSPNPNSWAESHRLSSLARTPFPYGHAPGLSPNPSPGPDVTPNTDPDLSHPNPKPNSRPKRPRSPLLGEPTRPPPPTRLGTTCELCLHRAAGNLSESSTMRHTCRSPYPAPPPPTCVPVRKRPRSPSSDCPAPEAIRRKPSAHPTGVG